MTDYYRYPPEPETSPLDDFAQFEGLEFEPEERRSSTPSGWKPRPYQRDSLDAFDAGRKRQILIWHRRAGKDNYALNLASREARKKRGTYWHLFPQHTQAKKAIWRGISKEGIGFLEQAFPDDIRKATRQVDMQIELKNGSTWQLCGSDRYNSLVGSNPRGVVFSEWALCDPRAWDYIRPILRENGGWCVFITTLRGKNHAYRMAKRLAENPDWYVDFRDVTQTVDHKGRRILTDEDIEAERIEGMSEPMIRQEYYNDPLVSAPGAIYGRQIDALLEAGRTGNFAYNSSRPVFASWSLEHDDQYTVAFWQSLGSSQVLVASASYPFESLSDALDLSLHSFPWRRVARHVLPHNTPGDKIECFENRGELVDIAPEVSSPVSITRDQLAAMQVDTAKRSYSDTDDELEGNNERLIDALLGYRFTEAQSGQSFTNVPVNSWEKHYARAVEVFATYRHSEPLELGGWHPAPDYSQHDARVI